MAIRCTIITGQAVSGAFA